jgi:hypothetical protein
MRLKEQDKSEDMLDKLRRAKLESDKKLIEAESKINKL